MAKVVIILEDATGTDGEEGLKVDVSSDPEFTDAGDETLSQIWAQAFLDMLLGQSGEVQFESEFMQLPPGSDQTH